MSSMEEIKQHRNLKTKLEEATAAQTAVVKALVEQNERERRERDDAKKLEFTAEMIKLGKLKCGVDIITKTKALENEFENKSVDLLLSSQG